MRNEFEEIRIIGLATEKTQPSPRSNSLRLMYIELSATPPSEWVRYFIEARTPLRHSKSRRAYIEENHIVIDCVPEEIEQHHMKELTQDIIKANQKMKEEGTY